MHTMDLTTRVVSSEAEALDLLFVGDSNRAVAETPLNMASSRSHCIFTITITRRSRGADTLRRAKLNLVDLAGSERVNKSRVDGATLQEAKYINVSLHFLEQVIVALQERADGNENIHVPYRNSLMTTMLRDSLGGNCQTVMIATASADDGAFDESVSTCRFAQRVRKISNEVFMNEELDVDMLIAGFKE
jgi:kinesin family protein 6/9